MKIPPGAIVREAAIVIAGAVLAALVMSQAPDLARWIKRQWNPPAT